MNVYVDNVLAKAKVLTTENIDSSFTADMLYDEVLSNCVVFDASDTVIEAEWGPNRFADTVAILAGNWSVGKLAVTSQGETVFNKAITSRGDHTIIKLPELVMVSSLRLELNSHEEKLEVGILFVGCKTELPLFNVGFKQKLNVKSKAERTRYGVVYGAKKTSLRSFELTFSDIDNTRRKVIENYIDEVQYVKPHLVEPYETREYPPVYATLADAGGFENPKDARFRWNTALSYMEAR